MNSKKLAFFIIYYGFFSVVFSVLISSVQAGTNAESAGCPLEEVSAFCLMGP
jgi:hypothetical protein